MQVRSFGGEKRQMLMFGNQVKYLLSTDVRSCMHDAFSTVGFIHYCFFYQVLEYQKSGIKLGVYKSINESITRVAVYVSLLALYILGGNKVKAVRNVLFLFMFIF